MKRKVLISLFVLMFIITGCVNKNKSKNVSSNNLGFKSTFVQGKSSDINKYEDIKNNIIDLESKLLNKKVTIKEIEFEESSNQLTFFIKFNKDDKLIYYYSLDKTNNEFRFYNCRTLIYDQNIFDNVKEVLINNFDFSESELNSIKEITKAGDYKRFRSYLVDYEEEKDSKGTKKEFRVMDNS